MKKQMNTMRRSRISPFRGTTILMVVCVFLVLGMGGVGLAEPFVPTLVGNRYEYTRTDNSDNTWTVWMDITEQVTLDSQDYFRLLVSNYDNDGVVEDEGLFRSTEDATYGYNPSGADYLEFQIAPVRTKWALYQPDPDGYDWKVLEIVAVGGVTVPYGTFPESYTRRAFQCVDPNDLSLGQTPSWYSTVVLGVWTVKEVDYWNDDPPMTMELVAITPEPALPGDVNEDGFVGGGDLTEILSNWGQSGLGWTDGDVDPYPIGDGFVGGGDYTEVLANWGAGTPPEAIPEPATLPLLLLGGLVLLRRI